MLLYALLFGAIPIFIVYSAGQRLVDIGKIESWSMYLLLAGTFFCSMFLMGLVMRRLTRKKELEQRKYYRLAGNTGWLPQEKREALQVDAHYCFDTGSWTETLEYWPAEVRMPGHVKFTSFELITKEDRLAANDQAWNVLSEKSYTERITALFTGTHSQIFALYRQLLDLQNRTLMISRLSELTQLSENYITACWINTENKPAALLWAFDLQRIVELSRTSFMAGIISEQKAWENMLLASDYIHALFDDPDDFFNNYRLGHAYWCNDFSRTNRTSVLHKAFNNNCHWPIKNVGWTKKDAAILPQVIRNGCKEFVEEEMRKRTRQTIGFRSGNENL